MIKGWKERILAISIAIILVLFIGYSINTFLNGEKYGEDYNRNILIIASISGIISIVIGVVIAVESVGAGLIGGGVLSLLYGIVRYWEFAPNVLRVVILGLALCILIWLGFKKFKDTK